MVSIPDVPVLSCESSAAGGWEVVLLCRGRIVAGMRGWSVPLGRCHICDTGPIVWFDPVDHFGVCEVCFARESAAVRNVGGVSERSERATGVGLSWGLGML
jgi:hypothetical protein